MERSHLYVNDSAIYRISQGFLLDFYSCKTEGKHNQHHVNLGCTLKVPFYLLHLPFLCLKV